MTTGSVVEIKALGCCSDWVFAHGAARAMSIGYTVRFKASSEFHLQFSTSHPGP